MVERLSSRFRFFWLGTLCAALFVIGCREESLKAMLDAEKRGDNSRASRARRFSRQLSLPQVFCCFFAEAFGRYLRLHWASCDRGPWRAGSPAPSGRLARPCRAASA